MKWIESLRLWLINILGGYADSSPKALMEHLRKVYLPETTWTAAQRSVSKTFWDPSFKQPLGSNLGREIRRDEAAEWAKLYLKDAGIPYKDAEVHLACELVYHLKYK